VAYTIAGNSSRRCLQTQQANEPVYTEAYGQLDVSASYRHQQALFRFFDGLNLTAAGQKQHGRYSEQFYSAS